MKTLMLRLFICMSAILLTVAAVVYGYKDAPVMSYILGTVIIITAYYADRLIIEYPTYNAVAPDVE